MRYSAFVLDLMNGSITEYRTNPDGEGLFRWVGGNLIQDTGTGQFNATSQASFQRKLRAWVDHGQGVSIRCVRSEKMIKAGQQIRDDYDFSIKDFALSLLD